MTSLENLENTILLTVILMARILGLFIFAPGFSMRAIPRRIKILLALTLSLLFRNYINYEPIETPYMALIYIGCEFMAGFIIGLISNLFMYVIQGIGEIIDSLLGTGIFQTPDTSGATSSITTRLLEYIGLLVFFISNSHLYLIYVITREVNFINVVKTFNSGDMLHFVIEIFNFIFINSVHLAMPFVLIFLLIDICLGIMNRSFSSFNIFLFSMPVKMMMFVIILLYYISNFCLNLQNLMTMNNDLLHSFMLSISGR